AWMDRLAPEMKQRVGLRPGVTGGFPQPGTSHTPAMTIGALQEAAFTPLYEHINELSETIKDISVIMDGLMQQFYTVGDYMNVSEQGAQRFVQWTQRHVVANFRREVVAAATTSMFDMDKHNRLAEIAAVANEALLQQNPQLIQSTIYLLINMDYPWAFDWVQLLQQELQRLQQQQQELQQLGALGLMQGQGAIPGGQPQALPPGEDGIDDDELAGLEELEGLTGVSAEELMMALEQE
ncbi:MAG: portal protein, partial [Planctomycetota bacterium]